MSLSGSKSIHIYKISHVRKSLGDTSVISVANLLSHTRPSHPPFNHSNPLTSSAGLIFVASPPSRKDSNSSAPPRSRPTTLDIPGLTRSKASPDGRIAQRDVGSKLVIVMVGLPARGKSYITKKIARYLNWLQHDTRIFNVGERRRVAAGAPCLSAPLDNTSWEWSRDVHDTVGASLSNILNYNGNLDLPPVPTQILLNGEPAPESFEHGMLPPPVSGSKLGEPHAEVCPSKSHSISLTDPRDQEKQTIGLIGNDGQSGIAAMDQSAHFFDPKNTKAAQLREEVAMATLDDLLDFILDQGGSVGIFDATNSTLERRSRIMERIRERAGSELGVLFLESLCIDENVRYVRSYL